MTGNAAPSVPNAGLPAGAVATAQRLAGIVHDEGGSDEVASLLAGLDRDDMVAVAVTLAAMVDVDRTPAELLAWYTGVVYKRCCLCRRSLELGWFQRDRSRRDGHNSQCRECKNRPRRRHAASVISATFTRVNGGPMSKHAQEQADAIREQGGEPDAPDQAAVEQNAIAEAAYSGDDGVAATEQAAPFMGEDTDVPLGDVQPGQQAAEDSEPAPAEPEPAVNDG